MVKAPSKPKTPARRKKPAAPAKPASPVIPAAATPQPVTPEFRKKALIEQVVARSGIKKRDAKPVIEATLAVLGEALAKGGVMNLQPFGKVIVKREIDKPNGRVFVSRIRQSKAGVGSKVVKIGTTK